MRIGAPDAALTANAGLAAVTGLCRRLGVIGALDEAVGPLKQRDRGSARGIELPLPAAARAGRIGHGDNAGPGKRTDEPQDAREFSASALAGEQAGPGHHGPGDAAPPTGRAAAGPRASRTTSGLAAA